MSRRGRGNRPGRCCVAPGRSMAFYTLSAGLLSRTPVFIALIIVGYCCRCVIVAHSRRTINILAFEIRSAAKGSCGVYVAVSYHRYWISVVFTTVTDDGTQKSYASCHDANNVNIAQRVRLRLSMCPNGRTIRRSVRPSTIMRSSVAAAVQRRSSETTATTMANARTCLHSDHVDSAGIPESIGRENGEGVGRNEA